MVRVKDIHIPGVPNLDLDKFESDIMKVRVFNGGLATPSAVNLVLLKYILLLEERVKKLEDKED